MYTHFGSSTVKVIVETSYAKQLQQIGDPKIFSNKVDRWGAIREW